MLAIIDVKNRSVFRIGSDAIRYVLLPAFVVALALFLDQNVILALLLTPVIAAVVCKLPHTALAITALSIMLVEALYYNLQVIPRQITWISDVVILLFAVRVFVFHRTELVKSQDPFRIPLLLFTAVFLSSTLLNSVSPLVTLVSIRQYFKYVILYLAITSLPMTVESLSRSLRFFFLLILAQVPVIIVCFLLGVRGDYLSGGLGAGGTAPLVLLCIAAANVFIGEYILCGRLLSLLKLALVAMVPAISEIKFGILIFPISVVATTLLPLSERRSRRRSLTIIVICGVLALGAVTTYKTIYPDVFARFGSWSFWSDYVNQEYPREGLPGHLYLGRMARMRVAIANMRDSLATALFGEGPGETSDSFFESGKGSLYPTILGDASGTQFSLVLLELGVLGLVLSTWMLIRLSRGLAGLYKVTAIGRDKALVCGLFGTSLMYVAYMFYLPTMFVTDTTSYLFWVSAAYLSLSMRRAQAVSH